MRAWRAVVEKEFTQLDPTGRAAAEIWRDFQQKLTRWERAVEGRRAFVESRRSGGIDAYLRTCVRPVAEVTDALRRATAPLCFGELTEPIAPTRARAAVLHSHLIRARFTLGDLLAHTGWLSEETAGLLLGEVPDQAGIE